MQNTNALPFLIKLSEHTKENVYFELRLIKQYGFSLTFGEKEKNGTSIVAPIFPWDDTIAAAISISIDQIGLLEQFIDTVVKCAKEISNEMGWIG
ncbi:IclR family transcriptional regulator C-terminal domain-containing protein [Metabacillus niabensis]|uniref:IclR family transcriptional regulator domain-containing protein n=1 Tax=Metabacillus niabensis TaxID=324854 RepID=UPI0039A2108D